MVHGFLLGFGIIFLLFSLYLFARSFQFLIKADRAKATLVEFQKLEQEREDKQGEKEIYFTYEPVFRFQTKDGKEIIHHHIFSYTNPSYKKGDVISIAYDPKNPSNAKLLTHYTLFVLPVAFLATALILIVWGGGYFFVQQYLK